MRRPDDRVVARGLLLGIALAGCGDRVHRDIKDEINVIVRRDDALVPPAVRRLSAYGRTAIPQIEIALHTAAPHGRLSLVRALGLIGDAEAAPILRHVAVYDVTPAIRRECEAILARWAATGDLRGGIARATLLRVEQKRAAGEGPVVSAGGTPGVPSTVGAPEPVGGELGEKR